MVFFDSGHKFFGSGSYLKKFLAAAPEWFGPHWKPNAILFVQLAQQIVC